jgi:hypothetical protein
MQTSTRNPHGNSEHAYMEAPSFVADLDSQLKEELRAAHLMKMLDSTKIIPFTTSRRSTRRPLYFYPRRFKGSGHIIHQARISLYDMGSINTMTLPYRIQIWIES